MMICYRYNLLIDLLLPLDHGHLRINITTGV